jgi:exopolyphosphatase/guanosine-5'-triphosphate,3'-diphosphate pyrophosphatase
MARSLPLRRRPGDASTRVARIAAIDIGSNSIRQLVADVSPEGGIKVVDEMKDAPRLGAGLAESGALSEEAMSRAIEALGRMALLAKQARATRIEAVATSAVRDAVNGRAFLSRVKRTTGLEVRLLSGEEEARLGFLSAMAHFDMAVGRTVVMDIGGGSLELALSAGGVVDRLLSFPLGTVRLTERFLGMTPSRGDIAKLRQEVRRELKAHWRAREWRGAQVIGSGGTFTNLAGMVLARQGLETARTVHATRVERLDLEHLIDTLGAMSPGERLKVPGLNRERADIILAGLCVAAEVLSRVDSRALVVSRYGIREGIVLEAARVAPVAADPGDARERSVHELGVRCGFDEPHAKHVRELALQLFDAVGDRIGCESSDRQLLADAALLHDIGYHISYDTHHKHSYHLILHADLLGVAPADQVVIANVARYHRGAVPKKSQRNFGSLDKETRRRIKRLAALLRIADGLDRGHVGAVGRVKVRWTARAMRITPQPALAGGTMRLELWGASRRRALLEDVADATVEFVGADGAVYGESDFDVAETPVRALRA